MMAGPEDYAMTAAQVAKANAKKGIAPVSSSNLFPNTGLGTVNPPLSYTPPAPSNAAVTYNPTTGLNYNPNAGVSVTDTTSDQGQSGGGNTGGGNIGGGDTDWTSNGNQALYKGVPFNGYRNGIQFINGYRQDMYDEKGNERTNKNNQTTTDTSATDALKQQQQNDRVSAYNILKEQFTQYGLGSLVDNIKGLLESNTPASEFALRLQQTPEYQARFSANKARIAAGLAALTPAQYVALEDQYQNVMRNYGLPTSYYTPDSTGKQIGFEKLLSNDVSSAELEDRIATAQQRVLNTNPEVLKALKQFYPDLGNADILAYTLDPQNALANIKRKVSAAEIGGAALAQGLQANGGTAESLAGQGITKAQAQQGYTDVANILPRGSQLADIYGQQPYNQATAEAEVFNTAGAAQAAQQRRKLTELEKAQFSGSSGVGALGRDKKSYGLTYGQEGLY